MFGVVGSGGVTVFSLMVKATDLAVSTLPALSAERYSTVCAPSADTVTLVPLVQAPPLTRYSV